jgi:hypothetical protein
MIELNEKWLCIASGEPGDTHEVVKSRAFRWIDTAAPPALRHVLKETLQLWDEATFRRFHATGTSAISTP